MTQSTIEPSTTSIVYSGELDPRQRPIYSAVPEMSPVPLDEAAVKDVTDPRGCGEDERWKPEEELEGVCGDMSDDEVPIITKPAEFHRKLIRGEWTSCDTNEVFPYNFGIACGNWGGEL